MKYKGFFSFPLNTLNLKKIKGLFLLLQKLKSLTLGKRQKIVVAVIILSLGLFFAQRRLDIWAVVFSFVLAFLTNLFLLWSNYKDLKGNMYIQLFILPFLFSLAFSLFYFLIPARILTKGISTVLYAIGLYSLFLSHNIFTVASIRTIALLASARIVSFILALLTYCSLAVVIISLDASIWITGVLMFLYSFFLVLHCLWIYTLEKINSAQIIWSAFLSLCLLEVSLILWFWPTSPISIGLVLTSLFYTLVSLSHVWLEKRLFKGVLWEYAWVAVIAFCVLIVSTSWKG